MNAKTARTQNLKPISLPVLGGAYRGKDLGQRARLAHLVWVEGTSVHADWAGIACRQNLDNIADSYCQSEEESLQPPTCPSCRKQWDKFHTSQP